MSALRSLSLCWGAPLLVACNSEPSADDADASHGSRRRSSLPGVPSATTTPAAGSDAGAAAPPRRAAAAGRPGGKPSAPPPPPPSVPGAGFEPSDFTAAPPSTSSFLDPLEHSSIASRGGGARSGSGGGALPRGAAAGAPIARQGSIASESVFSRHSDAANVFSLAAGRAASPALSRSGSRPILQPMPLPPPRAGLRSSRSMSFSTSLTRAAGLGLGRAHSTSTAGLPALDASTPQAMPPAAAVASVAAGRGGGSAGPLLADEAASSSAGSAGAASLQQRAASGGRVGSGSLLLASHARMEGRAIIRGRVQPRGLPSPSGSGSGSTVASDCGSAQRSLAHSGGSANSSALGSVASAGSSHLAAAAAAVLGAATDEAACTKTVAPDGPAGSAVAAAVPDTSAPDRVAGGGGAAAVPAATPAGAVQQGQVDTAHPRSAFSSAADAVAGPQRPHSAAWGGGQGSQADALPGVASRVSQGDGATAAGGTVEERKVAVGRAFGRAFVRALLAGNPKWASDPALSGLFAELARMVTHDKQRFEGRTAIIRRLNAGMEQFLKAIGHQQQQAPPISGPSAPVAGNDAVVAPVDPTSTADGLSASPHGPRSASADSSGLGPGHSAAASHMPAASAAVAVASDHDLAMHAAAVGISHDMKVYLQPIAVGPMGKGGVRQHGGGIRALMARPGRLLRSLAARLPLGKAKPAVGMMAAGGSGGSSINSVAGPAVVVVEYNFKLGMRRFRLQDQMVVSAQGRITRLKRLRP